MTLTFCLKLLFQASSCHVFIIALQKLRANSVAPAAQNSKYYFLFLLIFQNIYLKVFDNLRNLPNWYVKSSWFIRDCLKKLFPAMLVKVFWPPKRSTAGWPTSFAYNYFAGQSLAQKKYRWATKFILEQLTMK